MASPYSMVPLYLLFFLVGEGDLKEAVAGLTAYFSFSGFGKTVFCKATFSENFLRGSLLSIFSNSAGVY